MIVSLQLTILQWLLLKYVINIFPKVVDRFQCDVKKEQTIQPENGNHRYLQSLSIKEGFWRALTRHTDKNSFINVCYPAKNLPNNTCQGLVQACFQPLDVYEGYAAANVSVFDQLVVLNYLKDVGQVKVLLHCSHVQGSPYSFISEEFYVFNWLTPLACSEYKIGKDCRLTTTDNYIFDLSSLNEEVVKFNDTSLFISACRSHSKCGVGSSACLNNGNSTTNIGNFASNLFFNNNSQPSLLYQFENYTTNVIFLCGDNPISVKQVTENNYEIIWYTLLVCRQTIECSLIYKNLSYDLSILSQSNINWQVEISPELKTKFQRSKVYMNVCRPLVRDVLNKNCSSSSGLCIIHEDRVINVGRMVKSPYMDNGDIILEYSGGDMCDRNKNYSALVRLLDKNAMEIGNPYLKNDTDCVYQITWITSAAWHIMDERINASQTYDCKVVDKVTGIVFDINPLYNETGYLVNNTKGIFIVTVCGKLNNTECANSAISCIPAINDTGTWKLGYDEILYMNLWGHKHLIMFICDESAGVGHPELVDFIKPKAIFVWRTTYACKTMMQCTAFSDDGKAIELSSLGVPYFYNVTNEISKNVTGKFMLNICKGVVGTKCSPMSGACHENGQVTKNLGYLKDRPQLLSSGNVEILYENGDICDSENNLSSVIKIVCNISTENPIVKLISFEKCAILNLSFIVLIRVNMMSYTSDFEDNAGGSTKRKSSWKHDELAKKCRTTGSVHSSQLPSRSSYMDSYEKEERKAHIEQFLSMSAYARHKKLVHDYLAYYGGKMEDFERSSVNDKTDYDVIKENHKFIWDDHEDSEESWGKKLAKKYYDKLYKEYCICDLSQYKHNKVAMRWRVEKEVMEGRGQFSCGSRKCQLTDGLKSWEVNFGYTEHGEKKQALVKLRLCPDCSYKLNYTKKHNKAKKLKKKRSRKNSSINSANDISTDSQANEETEVPGSSKNIDNVWTQPLQENLVEKTREEEFDEYLEDLFL